MILILEVTSPQTTGASRHTFREEGGTIGRENDNAWVLPHSKVSGLHAVISHRNAVYYIEDRSRNGVYLNSSRNRLERGRPHPLKSGDRILIDPYEIRVSLSREQGDRTEQPGGASPARSSPVDLDAADPFQSDDPFAPRPMAPSALNAPEDEIGNQQLDPLELLDLGSKRVARRPAAQAKDLDRGSLLDGHYQPPAVIPAPSLGSPANATSIPEDYDPLAPDEAPPVPSAKPPSDLRHFQVPHQERAAPPIEPVDEYLPPEPPIRARPIALTNSPSAGAADVTGVDFGAVLAGAGLDPASITPEVAREFGEILRVVVSGVMDVMQSRQQIKDEFRMQGTRVRRIDNNPLKFSANVDDALHNLLMKRNRAFMSPVEAFEDAFADLRHHQIAMLAGMRTAFESMLAEFDPDHLQQEFDRQLAKGLVPAKLRYWDAYRDRQQQVAKDPEAAFRRLFGDEFSRAYENQLKALKAKERPPRSSIAPKEPGT